MSGENWILAKGETELHHIEVGLMDLVRESRELGRVYYVTHKKHIYTSIELNKQQLITSTTKAELKLRILDYASACFQLGKEQAQEDRRDETIIDIQ